MQNVKILGLTSILMLLFGSLFAQLKWVPYEGEMPDNAVMGGVENHAGLAVCRSEYQGAMHPGKVVGNNCNIGYGGNEKVLSNFEVLVNDGLVELDWLKSDGVMPAHAIKAGSENGTPLYVGRAYHEKGTHPGKIFKAGDKSICNIGYGGREITYNTFEVLVENHPDEKVEHLSFDQRCSGAGDDILSVSSFIGTVYKEGQINEGYSLVSSNLRYQTRVTDDGRLVVEEILDHALCNDGRIVIFEAKEIWSNTTEKRDASYDYYLKFQEDGNLCIYSEQAGFVWCSMCNGKDGHHLELTNIGHIEVVNSHGVEIWPN